MNMRMWMVNPKILCTKHLNGEHFELHKHRHVFVKHHSISGRLNPVVQIEPQSMEERHDELSREMIRRGGTHRSPYSLPSLDYLPIEERIAKVDKSQSLSDLISRCSECRKNYEKFINR